MSTTTAPQGTAVQPTWRVNPHTFTDAEAAAVRRYEALAPAERDRARRLVMLTGCSLTLACAAVEATRPQD